MFRTVVFSSLLFACDVGEIRVGGGDGGGSGSGSGSDCEQIAAAAPDGHHNPGMGCRSAAACHNAQLGLGVNAPEYSYGGTIYQDVAGTVPYVGASVFVTMGGTTVKAISANNGNFWFVPASIAGPSNAMTATTKASACPNSPTMVGLLVAGGGDCNNCHRSAGGTTLPVYVLPP